MEERKKRIPGWFFILLIPPFILILDVFFGVGFLHLPLDNDIYRGESARSHINKEIDRNLPDSATDLYYFEHRAGLDSFIYIGMTLPPAEGLAFMKRVAAYFLQETDNKDWIERNVGPQEYGFWFRTSSWDLRSMKKCVYYSESWRVWFFDQETGRLLVKVSHY